MVKYTSSNVRIALNISRLRVVHKHMYARMATAQHGKLSGTGGKLMPKLHKVNAELLETVAQQLNNAKMEYNAMVDAIKDMKDAGLDVSDLVLDYHAEISNIAERFGLHI
tara:strand:+ start:3194 stop:3523 length:330 start_codon:yes stop_codon:yes gene_type:complete